MKKTKVKNKKTATKKLEKHFKTSEIRHLRVYHKKTFNGDSHGE